MKKGFTLVEVIVSIAIMAIVGTMVSMVFVTISKYQSRKYETMHLQYHITQIHEVYLSDPLNWESVYFNLYGFNFEEIEYKDENILYFNKDFTKIVNYVSNYQIKYTYSITDENITNLVLTEIKRDDKVIDENINLGRFIEGVNHG